MSTKSFPPGPLRRSEELVRRPVLPRQRVVKLLLRLDGEVNGARRKMVATALGQLGGAGEVAVLKAYRMADILTIQATKGGTNSIIMCQDIAMRLGRPFRAVVRRTTGPGSSSW